jgi:hypothetical protein
MIGGYGNRDRSPPCTAGESTCHHFCDYDWDPAIGVPRFVSEPPGDGLARLPEARRAIERCMSKFALWLAGRLIDP